MVVGRLTGGGAVVDVVVGAEVVEAGTVVGEAVVVDASGGRVVVGAGIVVVDDVAGVVVVVGAAALPSLHDIANVSNNKGVNRPITLGMVSTAMATPHDRGIRFGMALTPPGPDLSRFVDAYRDDFERALGEIEAGRKQSHWMWYIFPQVAGLGASSMSRRYAIGSIQEAEVFLAHPVLGTGYREIVDAVWHQVVELGLTIHDVFGSPDDAKLVSSLTLFTAVARRLDPPKPALTAFVTQADDILRAAEAQGLPRCTTTEGFVAT